MSKTAMIHARIEPDLKQSAEAVLKGLGMTATEAVTLFYKQVSLRRGLPFDVRLPNAETQEAMRDVLERRDLHRYDSFEDLKAEIEG